MHTPPQSVESEGPTRALARRARVRHALREVASDDAPLAPSSSAMGFSFVTSFRIGM